MGLGVASAGLRGSEKGVGHAVTQFKGTVPRDYRLQVFFMNQFPQAPEYTIRAVSNFSKIRGDIR